MAIDQSPIDPCSRVIHAFNFLQIVGLSLSDSVSYFLQVMIAASLAER
jgi:hypothetical protein